MCATNVATLASREYSDGMQSFSSFAWVVAVQTKNGWLFKCIICGLRKAVVNACCVVVFREDDASNPAHPRAATKGGDGNSACPGNRYV